MSRYFLAIVGHGPDLERQDGAASVLRALGADVRTLDLWDEPARLFRTKDNARLAVEDEDAVARAIVVEALDRPDLAVAALRALRREPRLEDVGAIVAVTSSQVARLEPSNGFDDFVLSPYVPAELYARIRQLEWRRSEFANEERVKVGAMVIDRAAHEVTVSGAPVLLTAKEFALLAYLCDRRGKVVSRDELLRRVWGNRYEGGARTVDIHVRRLRAKLGTALPLATLRGAGYKLAKPGNEEDVEEGPSVLRAVPGRGGAGEGAALSRAILAVSIGCPSGVGPEVAVAGAARVDARCVLVGDLGTIRMAARLRRIAEKRLVAVDGRKAAAALSRGQIGVWALATQLARPATPGAPDAEVGRAQLAWIDEATDLVRARVADAMVTGPVSKLAIATSADAPDDPRAIFRGHTEHLAARLGAREVVMAFASDELVTSLVTTHLRLADVPSAVTPAAVEAATVHLVHLLRRLGKKKPRVAVAALNPHAGEGGLLGDEETARIAPGIARARARLASERVAAEIVGPMGAETAMRVAVAGGHDGVVAMYHDQATIPSKLLGFGEAVNVTLGLGLVRTSVDHGTAYDLAGTGRADPRGMVEAMRLASRLCS